MSFLSEFFSPIGWLVGFAGAGLGAVTITFAVYQGGDMINDYEASRLLGWEGAFYVGDLPGSKVDSIYNIRLRMTSSITLDKRADGAYHVQCATYQADNGGAWRTHAIRKGDRALPGLDADLTDEELAPVLAALVDSTVQEIPECLVTPGTHWDVTDTDVMRRIIRAYHAFK